MKKDILFPLRRLHGILYCMKIRRDFRKRYQDVMKKKRKLNPKTVFLILTPEHTNLGDHAIAFSESRLLTAQGIDYVEITGQQLVEMQNNHCLDLMNGYPIIMNGGGNMGTLWFNVERLIRDVISSNPRSPIFIMPNTIFYEDTPWGHMELENSKVIYNAHKRLRIYARERISLKTMQDAYCSVQLVPDMALSLDWSRGDTVRAGCLLCIRDDRERLCAEQDVQELYDLLQTHFSGDVCFTDMHNRQRVPVSEREKALAGKCMEFRKAALVVTDRLHGMIFCAITGTPCVVLNSRSPKLKGCYEWVRHLEYIKFCDNISDVLAMYHSIPRKKFTYDNADILMQHKDMICDIAEEIQ